VSRLYEHNACIEQRNNNFSHYPLCVTLNINNTNNYVELAGEATCRRVFAFGAQELDCYTLALFQTWGFPAQRLSQVCCCSEHSCDCAITM